MFASKHSVASLLPTESFVPSILAFDMNWKIASDMSLSLDDDLSHLGWFCISEMLQPTLFNTGLLLWRLITSCYCRVGVKPYLLAGELRLLLVTFLCLILLVQNAFFLEATICFINNYMSALSDRGMLNRFYSVWQTGTCSNQITHSGCCRVKYLEIYVSIPTFAAHLIKMLLRYSVW